MATLYTQSDKNVRLTWVYMTLFFIFLIVIGFVFSQAMDNQLILYLAVIISVVWSFGSYWWSDKLVLATTKAKEIDRNSNKKLYNVVENLCITAGLPVPKIYVIDSMAMNAFATGRDPEHAVVAVTKGLLMKLDRSELEGVIAHELSHIGNRDMLLSTVIIAMVGAISLLADFFLRFGWFGDRRRRDDSGGGYFFIIAIALSILAPLAATLVQLAISRKREFLADSNGALLTRYPEGLASALEKISADSGVKTASRTTAGLFIANPLKGGRGASKLFMTHPPVEERIKILRKMSV